MNVDEFHDLQREGRLMMKNIVRSAVYLVSLAVLLSCGNSAITNNNGATLTSIAITPNNPKIPTGASQQFIAIGTYADNTTQDISASTLWTSSDKSKADISNTGLATALTVGTTTITANVGSISDQTTLTIAAQTAILVSISVTPVNSSIAAGSTKQFTAAGTYSDNTTQNLTGSVAWSSSDTSKATVSNAGLATAIASGSTTITAISGGVSGTTTLTITTPTSATTLVSISVTPANPIIAVGSTKQFTATGTYSDNTTQNLTGSVAWSSSDTSTATITNAGLASAFAAGSTTIKASVGSIYGTTSLTVISLITGDDHLWGGASLSIYLGCLTCSSFDSDSVCNQYGTYGSTYSSSSIWNEYGTYGSPYNSYSPWNAYSSSGPGIFSTDGLTFYGYFTVNAYKTNRTQNTIYLGVLDYYANTQNLSLTRTYACGN